MKKKSTEISINTSSGVEKVENIEQEIKKEEHGKTVSKKNVTSVKGAMKNKSGQVNSAKGEAALGGEKKGESKTESKTAISGKAERESQAAKARVEAAIEKKKAQEKRKEERKVRAAKREELRKKRKAEKRALIEKRAAEKKARAEKHAAERKALAEKRKAEKEAKLRERAHAKANRNQARSKKKQEKAKQKVQKNDRRKAQGDRNKGYGGWIAAVVSLGVVSLALATTVTVGALDMKKKNDAAISGYRSTMYELTGIMENLDNDLDRVRISNSPVQQSRILTDLLVQARLAEIDAEKIPVQAELGRNVTVFINRTGMECERLLAKLRNGEALNEKDQERLEELYQKTHTIRQELDKMTARMTDKDLMSFVKDGKGMLKDVLNRLEETTMPENRMKLEEKTQKMAGAGMQPKQMEGQDKEKMPHIEAAKAEALCEQYFPEYKIRDFQCVGETVGRGYTAYNVQGYDEKGTMLFAEISQTDGALLRFDFYEDCMEDTFDIRNAERIAEEFLEKLGYEDVEVVRLRENGTTTDFTFVYEEDGVVYYPDEIRVKVCRTRGIVSGFDATKYLKNHKGRGEPNVKISLAEAYDKLHDGLRVESSRLAVVKTMRGERAAYEFLCDYQEESYFVFVDAVTGEEISIVNTKAIR